MRRDVVATGDPAGEARQRLLNVPPPDRAGLLSAPGVLFGGAHVATGLVVEGLDAAAAPLHLVGEVTHPDVAGLRVDGALVVRLDLESIVSPILAGTSMDELKIGRAHV